MKPKVCLCTFYLAYHKDVPENMSFRQAYSVGCQGTSSHIMYAMLCTRPDVAHALGVASRYQSEPGPAHWGAAKTILKYLRKTQDLFLVYGAKELVIEGFTDSSFQSDVDDFKSTSGYVFLLNGGAVTW